VRKTGSIFGPGQHPTSRESEPYSQLASQPVSQSSNKAAERCAAANAGKKQKQKQNICAYRQHDLRLVGNIVAQSPRALLIAIAMEVEIEMDVEVG